IAHKYGKILKLVMDSSDVYESNAEDFPAELNQVEDELQQSLYGKQDNESLFWEAVGKLKDDIKDLAEMINEQEGFE
ncbi:MAG: hypothetical protein ABIW38_01600, partial [Ferruginibacter sp.]